ncbi:hypothetical protein LZ189_23905, partial [Rhodovulum sulfidophilum]|nr:hypothetical protein [Rhodovulum sulfidophilum]
DRGDRLFQRKKVGFFGRDFGKSFSGCGRRPGPMGEVGMGASFKTTNMVDILLNFGILIADSPVMGEAGSWEAA